MDQLAALAPADRVASDLLLVDHRRFLSSFS